jgi:hypothetical protein
MQIIMKKYLTLIALTLFFSYPSFAKSLPPFLPQNGLVAWMPFDGNANDESGNNNNGTFIKATPTNDRLGNPNSAYSFNGNAKQYIMCTNANLPMGSSARTISMWMNYAGVVASGESLTALGYGQQTDGNSSMVGLYQGKVRFMTWAYDFDVNYNYVSNTWMHVAVTYDGTTAKMYVNGNIIGSGNYSNWNTLASSKFFIGTRPDSLNSFFNGKLDNIGIWNRALTASEVSTVYQEKLPDPLPSYLPQTGLLAWFPFNGNANDESGNGNDAVANTAQLTTDVKGNTNKAYQFDASLGQYIKCTNVNMPKLKSNRTFSMWLKPDAAITSAETMTSFGYGAQVSGAAQMLGLWQGKHRYMSWGSDLDIMINYNTSNWYHFVSTYDGIKAKVYLNGVALDSAQMSAWNTANSTYLFIGTRPDALNSFFNGKIDDIGVWGRVLNQAEISQLYNGPLSYTHELKAKENFRLYPNPTKDFVTIEISKNLSNSEAQVFNLAGQLVLQDYLNEHMQLDLQSLPKGLYFLRFKDLDQPGIKIVKE